MLKKIGVYSIHGKVKETIHIYCNDVVYNAIIVVSNQLLSAKVIKAFLNVINFHILNDNDKAIINGIEYTFFDINAKGTKQFEFRAV